MEINAQVSWQLQHCLGWWGVLIASQYAAYEFTIKISTGEIRFEEILLWLKQNTAPL